MYHCVYDAAPKETGFQNKGAIVYKLSASQFEEQVKLLCSKSKGDNVLFTFDDGGVSFHTVIAPILERYSQYGVFFISTQYIGTSGFMTSEQILDLYKRGHIIASHSHSHPENMTKLSREEMKQEWSRSVDKLNEIIGYNVTIASIPNGFASGDICEAARKAGITQLYTSDPTTKIKIVDKQQIIGRYAITNDMSTEYVASIVFDKPVRWKRHLRFKFLNIAKCILGPLYLTIRKRLLD